MSDSNYRTIVGVVQKFGTKPVLETREVTDQSVREFTIKVASSAVEQPLVRITTWPEFAPYEVRKGDLIAVEGKARVTEKDGKVYRNITATSLNINGEVIVKAEQERGTVNKRTNEEPAF